MACFLQSACRKEKEEEEKEKEEEEKEKEEEEKEKEKEEKECVKTISSQETDVVTIHSRVILCLSPPCGSVHCYPFGM